jgi:hypothetical protein
VIAAELIARLEACPKGKEGWKEFEDVCIATLKHLFVPPLALPMVQPSTRSGTDRRDAIFPNRQGGQPNNWGHLHRELEARLIVVECKNYDGILVGKQEVEQVRGYMRKKMGNLALVCSRSLPDEGAHIKRNSIFSEEGKVILFITVHHLKEMIFIKERGEDPSDLIIDLVERFYVQYE